MAVPAPYASQPQDPYSASNSDPCAAAILLDIVERAMHASRSEWLFFRELRVGTGQRKRQRGP